MLRSVRPFLVSSPMKVLIPLTENAAGGVRTYDNRIDPFDSSNIDFSGDDDVQTFRLRLASAHKIEHAMAIVLSLGKKAITNSKGSLLDEVGGLEHLYELSVSVHKKEFEGQHKPDSKDPLNPKASKEHSALLSPDTSSEMLRDCNQFFIASMFQPASHLLNVVRDKHPKHLKLIEEIQASIPTQETKRSELLKANCETNWKELFTAPIPKSSSSSSSSKKSVSEASASLVAVLSDVMTLIEETEQEMSFEQVNAECEKELKVAEREGFPKGTPKDTTDG
ncbi:uncharacterized protein MONOS_9612 [Monocercomonoides exilis]|uniref:uncharacterized protein n=1 Tax=Monocercomonoides exilis TaxID=2049356 RepID=UPI00355AB9BB|nr:hypothetical protein MONOS_9612 [Monocercomonoides exilis]|eukprot:MONOS_9612.1-p1 / transcript=MONOS_9612.1 / gene=MONOS_9612 / organism=Monocercomonoides_exilis_PA203 / gene_product=unspecified product / transcript_product=unspecified product / location=Mono_scaffold00402:43125-43964(-) / protein_length=280 / sequence_SO=supercontig / SO=protein_coding / is_pseudo=false